MRLNTEKVNVIDCARGGGRLADGEERQVRYSVLKNN